VALRLQFRRGTMLDALTKTGRIFAYATALTAACAIGAVGCGANDGDPNATTEPSATDPADEDGGDQGAPGSIEIEPTSDGGASHDASPDAKKDGGGYDAGNNPCAPLTFPSGVKIQAFPNAAMTASYANHLASGQKAPKCFLDVNNLVDADTGAVHPITVKVGAHFTLEELVGTEVSQGYGHFVVMTPAGVTALEKFRDTLNVSVSVISGYRSPKHQEDVCKSLCGNPLGCAGTCANNSRHMFGDAFDLPLQFYTTADEHVACNSGFKFAYKESGTHLHVDQNPAYSTCVIE
jgi:hypothetical protein